MKILQCVFSSLLPAGERCINTSLESPQEGWIHIPRAVSGSQQEHRGRNVFFNAIHLLQQLRFHSKKVNGSLSALPYPNSYWIT